MPITWVLKGFFYTGKPEYFSFSLLSVLYIEKIVQHMEDSQKSTTSIVKIFKYTLLVIGYLLLVYKLGISGFMIYVTSSIDISIINIVIKQIPSLFNHLLLLIAGHLIPVVRVDDYIEPEVRIEPTLG